MKIDMQKIVKYFLFTAFGAFTLASIFSQGQEIDEYYFHIPTLKNILENDLYTAIIGEGYQTANTPMPYLVTSMIYKFAHATGIISGENDSVRHVARFTNILIGFFLLFLFAKKFVDSSPNKWLPVSIIFFYPYFLKTNFLFYQAIWGLLFFIIYLHCFSRDDLRSWIFSGLSLTAAILCQQFYLVLIPAKPIYKFLRVSLLEKKSLNNNELATIGLKWRDEFFKSAAHYIFLVIPATLFYFWEGLTHPEFKRFTVSFTPTNVTAIFTIIGITFIPFLFFKLKEKIDIRRWGLFFAVAIIMTIFFTPAWGNNPEFGKISGYVFHSLEFIKNFSPILKIVFQIIFISAGLEILFRIFSEGKVETRVFAFLFVAGFSFNAVFSERHLLPLIVLIYLSLLKELKTNQLFLWNILQTAAGSVYFYYLFAFNNY